MKNQISVYIPIYNHVTWCREFEPLEGFRYIASDNASTDGSGDVLKSKGVEVIRQPENIGRVENWEFCVRHFAKSGVPWMKWLFAGDRLLDDASLKLSRAMEQYPQIKLIFGEFYYGDGVQKLNKSFPGTIVLSPERFFYLTAERGNLFGGIVSHCTHRDAVSGGLDFGRCPWVADMRFYMSFAEKFPMLYLAEPIGIMNYASRRYRGQFVDSLSATVQEYEVRHEAASKYLQISKDESAYRRLIQGIDQAIESKMLSRALNRANSPEEIRHLGQVLESRPKFLRLLIAELPLPLLIRLGIGKVRQAIKRKLTGRR